jgi:hypothetical protein
MYVAWIEKLKKVYTVEGETSWKVHTWKTEADRKITLRCNFVY